jgi:hypothetical protein
MYLSPILLASFNDALIIFSAILAHFPNLASNMEQLERLITETVIAIKAEIYSLKFIDLD